MKNYYDELEVSKSASKEVISKVYKILAKKYHPDTTTEPNKQLAEEKFKAISEAYEVLSDDKKRKEYNIKLEQSTPSISYEEYLSVIKQRDSLNTALNSLTNDFNHLKNSINSSSPHSSNYMDSNFNNSTQTHKKINNNSKKSKYYNVATGQPVSAFAYYKYKIKQFFSNLFLIILSIIVGIMIFNTFSKSNLFDYFNLFLN